jgi:hypothetical protein
VPLFDDEPVADIEELPLTVLWGDKLERHLICVLPGTRAPLGGSEIRCPFRRRREGRALGTLPSYWCSPPLCGDKHRGVSPSAAAGGRPGSNGPSVTVEKDELYCLLICIAEGMSSSTLWGPSSSVPSTAALRPPPYLCCRGHHLEHPPRPKKPTSPSGGLELVRVDDGGGQ